MTFMMRPEDLAADRHLDRRAGVLDRHAADQAVGGVHGDAADVVLAQVLRDLDDQVAGLVADRRVRDPQRGVDLRQVAAGELHVDDRADDLDDLALAGACTLLMTLCVLSTDFFAV